MSDHFYSRRGQLWAPLSTCGVESSGALPSDGVCSSPTCALYFWAQMFLWWPLWDLWRAGWVCFLFLFVANTALNIQGHFGQRAASSEPKLPLT